MNDSLMGARGRTTIPRAVREALGPKAGDRVRSFVSGKEVRLMRVVSVMDLIGTLYREGQRPISIEEMEEGIAEGACSTMSGS